MGVLVTYSASRSLRIHARMTPPPPPDTHTHIHFTPDLVGTKITPGVTRYQLATNIVCGPNYASINQFQAFLKRALNSFMKIIIHVRGGARENSLHSIFAHSKIQIRVSLIQGNVQDSPFLPCRQFKKISHFEFRVFIGYVTQ